MKGEIGMGDSSGPPAALAGQLPTKTDTPGQGGQEPPADGAPGPAPAEGGKA
jgi:hypothetical protein